MRVFHYPSGDHRWYFVNAFAANDPESTTGIWESACDRFPGITRRVAVMNCRSDRRDRSKTMAEACADWRSVDQFVVLGTGTDSFIKPLIAAGMAAEKITSLGEASAPAVADTIASRSFGNALILGVGNVAGPGMALADFFEAADVPPTSNDTSPAPSQQPFTLVKAA
jgi:poly-gamma-glutamate synthase PgsB/CapB